MKTPGKIAGMIGLLIILAFAGSIGKFIGKSTIRKYEKGKLDAVIEETLMESTRKINSQLPVMVDQEMRFDTAMCLGKEVHYKYTMVNYLESELDKQVFQKNIATMLVKNQCTNQNMINVLKLGVTYYYTYFDKNGIRIATINISKEDCGL